MDFPISYSGSRTYLRGLYFESKLKGPKLFKKRKWGSPKSWTKTVFFFSSVVCGYQTECGDHLRKGGSCTWRTATSQPPAVYVPRTYECPGKNDLTLRFIQWTIPNWKPKWERSLLGWTVWAMSVIVFCCSWVWQGEDKDKVLYTRRVLTIFFTFLFFCFLRETFEEQFYNSDRSAKDYRFSGKAFGVTNCAILFYFFVS